MRSVSFYKLALSIIIIAGIFLAALCFYNYYFYHYTEIGKLIYQLENSPDAMDRAETAFKLGDLRENGAVYALIDALKNDPDVRVRAAAAVTLANIGDKRAVEPLICALENDKSGSMLACAQALGILDDDRAMPVLTKTFEYDNNKNVRLTAAMALNYLGNPIGFDFLVSSLTDEDPVFSGMCAYALEGFNDSRAVVPLINMLENTSTESEQAYAVQTLGVIGDCRAAGAIINLLENSGDEFIRSACVLALGKFTDERAIAPLIRALENKSGENIGMQAGFALGRLADIFNSAEAEGALFKARENGNWGAALGLAWSKGGEDIDKAAGMIDSKSTFYIQLARARWGDTAALDAIFNEMKYKYLKAYYNDIFSRMPGSFPKYDDHKSYRERKNNMREIKRWFNANKHRLKWDSSNRKYFIQN